MKTKITLLLLFVANIIFSQESVTRIDEQHLKITLQKEKIAVLEFYEYGEYVGNEEISEEDTDIFFIDKLHNKTISVNDGWAIQKVVKYTYQDGESLPRIKRTGVRTLEGHEANEGYFVWRIYLH